MSDTDSGSADFAPLGEMEITCAGDLFAQCEFLRRRASNAGLIVVQWAADVEWAFASVPVMDPGGWHGIGADTGAKRARRVARHAYRAAESLKTVAESAAKLPPAYLKAYADIIQRRKDRTAFDPRAGL
jgi:hypothetical protein